MNVFLEKVSVLMLTFDEEANVSRSIGALNRFPEVVVLDSGSKDRTIEIAKGFPNVRIERRAFDNHSSQWNHGLFNCGIERPWILALDADHVVSKELVEEIALLSGCAEFIGFAAKFRYCVYGKPLRASLYPPRVALYKRTSAKYIQEGHTQRLCLKGGRIGQLFSLIDHDDRKSLTAWFHAQVKYSKLEAEFLLAKSRNNLSLTERVRLTGVWGPVLVFVYSLMFKRCILDGWAGWLYVLQRVVAEAMIAMRISENRNLSQRTAASNSKPTNSGDAAS